MRQGGTTLAGGQPGSVGRTQQVLGIRNTDQLGATHSPVDAIDDHRGIGCNFLIECGDVSLGVLVIFLCIEATALATFQMVRSAHFATVELVLIYKQIERLCIKLQDNLDIVILTAMFRDLA